MIDQISQTVRSFFDAVKDQPLAIILGLMNIALLVLFYVIIQAAEHRHQQVADQQKHLVELLAACTAKGG